MSVCVCELCGVTGSGVSGCHLDECVFSIFAK